MRSGRTLALIVLALLAGGIVSQVPSALGDNSENPFNSIWSAILDLQNKDTDLQSQINELKVERNALPAVGSTQSFGSDMYAAIQVQSIENGHTVIHITAGNKGPNSVAGVKLTVFYLMPLYQIESISTGLCQDKSRGIIECALGMIEAGQQNDIMIDAFALESGKDSTWTADISTTTSELNYTNNHVTNSFQTSIGESKELVQLHESQLPVGQSGEPEAEGKQNHSLNSNSTNEGTNSTNARKESQSSTNQTSTVDESNSTGSAVPENDASGQYETQGTSENNTRNNSAQDSGKGKNEEPGSGDNESVTG